MTITKDIMDTIVVSPDNDDFDLQGRRNPGTVISEKDKQRALVYRLDRRLLIFAMFGNMVKTLDNTNLGNAFISGMEEELHVVGVQYNWMLVLFMIGYLCMQVPSNILLSRLRPSIYLPALEMIWCILTLSMACVQSVQGVYIIRFLLGLAEAGFYPGIIFLIGTWYSRKELGKRTALLTICGALGGGMSGIIQAILLKTMDGAIGISGWRWLFLFDGSVTAVLAVLGYMYLPDYPHNTSWLNHEEREIAMRRLKQTGIDSRRFHWSSATGFRSIVTNKFFCLLVVGWASVHLSLGAAHVLGIVAKKIGYDAISANLFTTPDMIVTMIVGLANGFLSDRYKSRLWFILAPSMLALVGASMLAAFVQPFGLLYFAFILTHAGLGCTTPIVMAWASEIMAQNVKTRAVAIAAMNTSSSLMYTWAPLVLWPVTDAPRYRLIGFFHFQHQKPSSADEIALLEEEMPVDGIPTSDMSIDDESKSDISSLYKHEDLQ